MKYIDSMTSQERAKFMEEVNELDAVLRALPNPTSHNNTRREQMSDLQILIEEVARIALESHEMRRHIGHELGASDEELEKAFQYLDAQLKQGETK